MFKGLSIVEIMLVLYIIIGLLLAYPLYHSYTESGISRASVWASVLINSVFWPRFVCIFIINLRNESAEFSPEEDQR